MKHTHLIHHHLGAAIAAATLMLLAFGEVRADTVKLKDGNTLEGLITFEGDDMLKIKVQKSATISETKTVLRSDIAEVIKSAPDDVDFAKIKQLLPSPSLVTTSQYRTMIEKGPQAFLNSYPGSKHRPEVEKIQKELEEELARVDQGSIKLEGEWISPDAQQDFKELIAARILNLRMKQKAQGANFIGALRDFETMEETYYGTPSFVEAVRSTQQLLPALGQRLKRMAADVDFQNKQFQEDLMKMPEINRKPVVEARAREEAALRKRFEADKATGVKWYLVNQRDKADLTTYINIVSGEIERLNGFDLVALEEQSKELVKVDQLLAEDKLAEAKELLKSATGVKSGRSTGGSKKYSSGYGSYGKTGGGSRKSSGANTKTSYTLALREKILQQDQAIATARTQAENTAEGTKASNLIRSEDVVAAAAPSGGAETVATPAGGSDALGELIKSTKVPEKAEPADSGKKKPSSKTKKSSSKKSSDVDEEDKPKRNVASGGFQFKFKYVIWGVTGLLVLGVVLMKVLGIGAKES